MADGGGVIFSEKLARRRLTLPYKRELRANAEAAIDQFITLIDAIDGDPDFEPDLSQSTGNAAHENQRETWAALSVEGDRNEDLEPATAPDDVRQRDCWFSGGNDDNEPSLGSSNSIDQTSWGDASPYTDAEEACEDEGGQCEDEGVDTDSEPWEQEDAADCGTSPFAMDQSGNQWAYGDNRSAEPRFHSSPIEKLREDRASIAAQPSAIQYLSMDRDGNVSFMKDGARWVGGRLIVLPR